MKWIFLSPHFDDVVFSCGGLVWELVQSGDQVEIWTICAGDPPDELSPFAEVMHRSWGLERNVVTHRREEDIRACQFLGAEPRHFQIQDCIYRRSPIDGGWLYTYEDALFGGLDPVEKPLVEMLAVLLEQEMSPADRVVSPLGIGNHVDHDLTRKAAHRLDHPLRFYADYPYAREESNQSLFRILEMSDDWDSVQFRISDSALTAWQQASLCYRSQIEIFWEGEAEMAGQIEAFSSSMEGIKLWMPVEDSP